MLLSVVGKPPQDADRGKWDAPNLYLGLVKRQRQIRAYPNRRPCSGHHTVTRRCRISAIYKEPLGRAAYKGV